MSSEQFSAQARSPKLNCPYCGAANVSARPQRCWLCHAELGEGVEPPDRDEHIRALTERIALRGPRHDPSPLSAFGILAILISLGLALVAPGVLILILILATPALIRSAAVSGSEGQQGSPVWSFLGSLGTVVVVGAASFAAFFATCFVVCLGGLAIQDLGRGSSHGRSYEWILVASVGAGLVPGIALAIFLFRRFWARKA